MIQYTLRCDQDHRTESWFKSADAFDALKRAGHLSCAVCGSSKVEKALMAPRVSASREEKKAPGADASTTPMLNAPSDDVARAVAELRRKVEETSDYVGDKFAEEARAMHEGDKPGRSIWGEARADQAKSLIEDGVPLLPLPFKPRNKLS